jgi:glycosyltransferase involved in cell wall biosynthesis
MIGQRGVPATFGGVERHVQEVGARLAARGHEVTVYCRKNYRATDEPVFQGMRMRNAPTVGTKHLDAIVHSAASTALSLRRPPDIVHYHALGPGLLAPLPRFFSRSRVVLTVHGLDSHRAKWGPIAKSVLKTAEWMSGRIPDATIAVSRDLSEYYSRRHNCDSIYIPNGVQDPIRRPASEISARFGLTERGYVLFVGRLVPEKAPDLLIRAFRRIPGNVRLVLAGGSSFTTDFVRGLHELAAGDPRIVFTDYAYGPLLEALYNNAAAFVLPSNLEGLPLTLLEAASFGLPIVASAIPPHLEVIGTSAPGHRLFAPDDERSLRDALQQTLATGAAEWVGAHALRQRVLERYRWDATVDDLEQLYYWLLRSGSRMVARDDPRSQGGELVASGVGAKPVRRHG